MRFTLKVYNARAMREKLKNKAKKAQKQQRISEEASAAAPELTQLILEAQDEDTLRVALEEAVRMSTHAPDMSVVIAEGRERLQQLEMETRAARKAATMEVCLCDDDACHDVYLN